MIDGLRDDIEVYGDQKSSYLRDIAGVERPERIHAVDIFEIFDGVGCFADRLAAFEVGDGERKLLAVI